MSSSQASSPTAACTTCTAGAAPVRGLATLALTLGTFFAASSAPTPLYRLYQQSWGFSSGTLTLVFAVYAFSLLLALLTTGALSDHLGRKPVILTSLVLEVASLVVFAQAGDVRMLFAARLLQGFATGMASAAIGAALLDLHRERGTLISTMSPMLGMAVGILVAGEFAQLWRNQLGLVFWLLVLLLVAAGTAVLAMPETGLRRPGALAAMRPRVRIPVQARQAFFQMLPMSIAVWALGGFYLSLGPSMIRSVTGSELAASFGICINMLSAAAGIWTLRGHAPRTMLRFGGGALFAGVALMLAGAHFHSLAMVLGASVVAGTGFGSGFQGALRSMIPLAAAHERGALLSAIYIASYLAFSVPAIVAGVSAAKLGLMPVTYAYGSMLMLFAALALAGTWRAGASR
ncbi:MFS transporter [Diaphorobacter ruginosibacter]|uniref:MFS transporter n=1 Tax=Diaphorobacter ruginosibacter TaxID=1715720 RepID=A0A7G9RS43_9BURK|nr:MFS transporter [Diaphorobacter ruginosibacter]QNN58418.1 MFS transporter [Diaphorobacter ruginosibacter]